MARALWKGSIAFGLVNIPVELHTAVRDSRPRFRMLHAEDKSPVKFERVCAREGRTVAWDELVKGYEYEKGRFVVLTKEDFRAAALEKSRTVDIRSFVKEEEIDDRFFETSYSEVVDLMERLRESLQQAGTTRRRAPARKASARKARARGKKRHAA
jgi:DNA end-binding protein Ku